MTASAAALGRSERRLTHLLRTLAALFLGAAIFYGAGPFLDRFGDLSTLFRQLPFVAASVVKVSLLGWLCLYAGADIRRRHPIVRLVILGHVVSVVAMLILIFAGTADSTSSGDSVLGTFATVQVKTALWGAIGLDGVILLILIVLYARTEFKEPERSIYELDDHRPSTPAECNLRAFARLMGFTLLAAAVAVEWLAVRDMWPAAMVELPFVTNTVVALSVVALVCLYVARSVREHMSLIGLVVIAQAMGVFVLTAYWAFGQDNGESVVLGTRAFALADILLATMAATGLFGILAFAYYQMAWRSRYRLKFLQPMEFRTLLALAEILIVGDDEVLSPLEVAQNVDRDVNEIGATRRRIYRLILFVVYLHPLLYFRAPLPEMASSLRSKHVRKHFHYETLTRPMPEWLRQQVQGMIRAAKQLVYVGYYNDSRVHDSVNYVPFSKRPPRPGEGPRTRSTTTVDVWDADHAAVNGKSRIGPFDICIIGSGAAGGILAYELAKRHSAARILVIERGKYVPPSRFTENEVEMMGQLYADGLFQQTRDNRFTILQGSCVGGSTVVNNAVCFDPPAAVLDRWKDEFEVDFGLDLKASVDAVRTYLKIQLQNHPLVNPSAKPYVDHAGAASIPIGITPVEANIDGCLGCGYCNIGCAYSKKLSMLDTALPDAQRTGSVHILAECEIERIRTRSGNPRRVENILGRLRTPGGNGRLGEPRWITIEADTFILAAGAIASPWLLMKSGIRGGLPVGKGMSFNMGSPITAEFPDRSRFTDGLPAYAGLQISHAGIPSHDRGWVAETWWNPPLAQAINLPGWFEHHYDNMRKYDRLMAVGLLVGTASAGEVKRAATGGPDVKYTPNPADLGKLAEGLKVTAEILLDSGASKVMLNTAHPDGRGDEMATTTDLARIREIVQRGSSYLTLGTGHPQGGNAISPDPRRGVVNTDFRVHGYANLYLCDASIFPTSLTVNPQLTIMGLAHLAAGKVMP